MLILQRTGKKATPQVSTHQGSFLNAKPKGSTLREENKALLHSSTSEHSNAPQEMKDFVTSGNCHTIIELELCLIDLTAFC